MSVRSAIARLAIAVVVGSSALAVGSVPAYGAWLGNYWVEAKRPPSNPSQPPLFVGVGPTDPDVSAVRLFAYIRPETSPADRYRLQWRVAEHECLQSQDGTSTRYACYSFYNAETGRCLSYNPPMANGNLALQRVPPEPGRGCRSFALDNGVKRVKSGDATGQRYGFRLVLDLYQNWCLDVRDLRYQTLNPLQWWSCHNGWNQKFFIRIAPPPAVPR